MNLEVKENLITYSPHGVGEVYYPESDGEPMAETDKHRNLILYLISCLEIFFADREDIYVSGNIMFYYVEGDATQVVAPDVMVCFGIPKGERTSYKTWEENDVVPSVVIEISSRGTWTKDRIEKRLLYESLGVEEYYIFNPLFPKNSPSFLAYRLENNELNSVKIEYGRIKSEVLGLELVETEKTLRLFNPETGEFLKTTEEFAEENRQLKAEIERLKTLLETKS